jgi:hypothetical protein
MSGIAGINIVWLYIIIRSVEPKIARVNQADGELALLEGGD